jgi:hypothetical protein
MSAKTVWMYVMIAVLVFVGAMFLGAALNQ